MLLHCVFLHYSNEYTEDQKLEVLRALEALASELDGVLRFDYGPNRDFEHKSPDYTHGFVILFRDRKAHLIYDGHPRHRELGAQLVRMCVGGGDGIVVYDIDCGKS